MPDACFIQVGTGGWNAALDVAEPHHAAYCAQHGMEWRPVRELLQTERHPIWCKVWAIRQALAEGFPWVFCLDGDALVVDTATDLRSALTYGDLGLSWHVLSWMPLNLNTGVSYVRNTPRMREFYERVAAFPHVADWDASPHPLGARDGEQHSVVRVLQETGFDALQILHQRWNYLEGAMPPCQPVVKAWHGVGGICDRKAAMAAELERMKCRPPL